MKTILTRCPDEGSLRAHLDGELDEDTRAAIAAHLVGCQRCAETAAHLAAQAELVRSALARGPVPRPSTRAAWYRFEARQAEMASESPVWRLEIMLQTLRFRHWRSALAATALVALLVSVMAIDPLRATAAQFLRIFRVQNFTVVQIPGGQTDRLRSAQELVFGKPQESKVAPTNVDSVEQASKLTGFDVLTPGYLPARAQQRTQFVVEGGHPVDTQVNLVAARGLLKAAGLPTDSLPADRDSIPLHATVPAGVMMEYGSGASAIKIIQSRSPQIDVPDGIDLAQLGAVTLRYLGLPADQASRLSQSINWATTLVVPIPADAGKVQEVSLRGGTGYLMSEVRTDGQDNASVVFWESNGLLYAVGGTIRPGELVQVAESLK